MGLPADYFEDLFYRPQVVQFYLQLSVSLLDPHARMCRNPEVRNLPDQLFDAPGPINAEAILLHFDLL